VSGASAGWLGVVVVPAGVDVGVELLGLELLTRHALALQSAGCGAVVVLGEDTKDVADARLHVPVHRVLVPHEHALVVRADVTTHRTVPPRMAHELELEPGEVARAGDDAAAVYACGADRTGEVARALLDATAAPFDRAFPLLGGVSAEFVVPSASHAARRRASWKHLVSLRKSTSGYFERLYMRPLSMFITWPLASTRVSPNAMSVVTFVIGIASAVMVGMPSTSWNVAGALVHLFMRIVDCVDGELARLRYQGSSLGAWLDSIFDGIAMAAFVGAVGYRLDGLGSPYAVVGYAGAAVWMGVQLLEWRAAWVSQTGGTVQTIEWGHRKAEPSPFERFVAKIELLLRMDAISTYYAVGVIFGLLEALVVIHTVIATVAVLYYVGQVRKLAAS
jgi:phosphatidylglycerophosphate synthase